MNYGQLRSLLETYLSRTDLSVHAPLLVELAHTRIFGRLRIRSMETTLPISITSERVPLPEDFLQLRQLWLEVPGGRISVESTTAETQAVWTRGLVEVTVENELLGPPRRYTIIGNELAVAPLPGPDGVEATLIYYAMPPLLAADADTNTVLTRYPRVYLYGALYEFAQLSDDERMGAWNDAFMIALSEAEMRERIDDQGRTRAGLTPSVQAP